MREEVLFSLDTPYREPFEVRGFRFGGGTKSCAIVGGIRGNEVQQMYICALLVKAMKKLEEEGALLRDREILIIPCVNNFSMNVGSRFWPMDKTDINRMFPGYDQGETTQRIAAALFEAVQGYRYGVHFASFYLPGDFSPHVRIMQTGYESASMGNLFGLPYVVIREPAPIDTTTLNYNWQVWNTSAFSIYTKATEQIDEEDARTAVSAILRFLSRLGIIRRNCFGGCLPTIFAEKELRSVLTPCGGLFRRGVDPGTQVSEGQVLANVLDPLTAEVTGELKSPADGIIFFAMSKPLVTQHEIAFRIIPGLKL